MFLRICVLNHNFTSTGARSLLFLKANCWHRKYSTYEILPNGMRLVQVPHVAKVDRPDYEQDKFLLAGFFLYQDPTVKPINQTNLHIILVDWYKNGLQSQQGQTFKTCLQLLPGGTAPNMDKGHQSDPETRLQRLCFSFTESQNKSLLAKLERVSSSLLRLPTCLLSLFSGVRQSWNNKGGCVS